MPVLFRTENGRIVSNREGVAKAFRALKDGLWVFDPKWAKKRSTRQNAFYWLLLTEYIQPALYEAGYDNITTPEKAHEFCKREFLQDEAVVNKKTGDIKYIPRHTSDLNTIEWEEYRETLNKAFATYYGVVLPDPLSQLTMFQ